MQYLSVPCQFAQWIYTVFYSNIKALQAGELLCILKPLKLNKYVFNIYFKKDPVALRRAYNQNTFLLCIL